MDTQLEEKILKVIDDYIVKQTQGAVTELDQLQKGEYCINDLREAVREINEWIDVAVMNNMFLYEHFRYHLIVAYDGSIVVVQGEEINTNPPWYKEDEP